MKKFPKIDSSILQWIDKNKLMNSRKAPFEWTLHSFLLQPMSDWSRRIAVKKSSQIGFSESFGILKAVYGALAYKWNIVYTLPTDSFAEKFVKTKLDPIIQHNKGLDKVIKGGASIKQIADSFAYFQGTYNTQTKDAKASSDKAISITSDLNIHDESDRSDQNTIEQYESRLENSDYAGIWNFSNPSFPGVGADGLYDESDQKVWMVQCSHCNHRQWLDWVKLGEVTGIMDHCLIDPKNELFLCGKCQGIITDTDRMQGEWVAKYPGKDISGYWMSQMNYARHQLHTVEGVPGLLAKEKKQERQNFYNFVLGLPYRGTDDVVDRSAIIKNINMTDNNEEEVAMGVDNGIWKHYVIGNKTGIFKVGRTKDWDEIEYFIKKYNAITVIDSNPYPNQPKKLAEKYRNRVFTAFYKKDKDMMGAVEWGKQKDRGTVRIQRTKYFDILVDKFIAGEKPINMLERDLTGLGYITHWERLARMDVENAMGIVVPEWISSHKDEHYAHATVYQDVAMQRIRSGGAVDSYKPRREADDSIVVSADNTSSLPNIDEIIKQSQKPKRDWRYV